MLFIFDLPHYPPMQSAKTALNQRPILFTIEIRMAQFLRAFGYTCAAAACRFFWTLSFVKEIATLPVYSLESHLEALQCRFRGF